MSGGIRVFRNRLREWNGTCESLGRPKGCLLGARKRIVYQREDTRIDERYRKAKALRHKKTSYRGVEFEVENHPRIRGYRPALLENNAT